MLVMSVSMVTAHQSSHLFLLAALYLADARHLRCHGFGRAALALPAGRGARQAIAAADGRDGLMACRATHRAVASLRLRPYLVPHHCATLDASNT
jgi:hypothetical protein